MSLLIALTMTLWTYLGLRWITRRRVAMLRRVDALTIARVQDETFTSSRKSTPVFRNLLRSLSRRLPVPASEAWSRIQTRLLQAGSPRLLSPAEWIGMRFICVVGGSLVGLLFILAGGAKMTSVLALVGGILLGWIGPDFWLSRRITARQAIIRKQLPSVLDMLTVSVEAGYGFDQAMSRVAAKMKGPLPIEFGRALREVQLGLPRIEALQGIAARSGVDGVQLFVSAVIQADRLGVGMAQVLRVQSEEVRQKRKLDAQERAMRAPIKMLFPLVLFVFPSLFIVILGPAVLHMLHGFG